MISVCGEYLLVGGEEVFLILRSFSLLLNLWEFDGGLNAAMVIEDGVVAFAVLTVIHSLFYIFGNEYVGRLMNDQSISCFLLMILRSSRGSGFLILWFFLLCWILLSSRDTERMNGCGCGYGQSCYMWYVLLDLNLFLCSFHYSICSEGRCLKLYDHCSW